MCISCGCGEGLDDHGSQDNITADQVVTELTDEQARRAADAQGISVEEVLSNLAAAKKNA